MTWQHQIGFPILSAITYLPLVGVALILLLGKGRPTFYKVVSLVVVVLGIGTAYDAYLRRPELPARIVARVPWAYQASLHKFYMDEIYDAGVVRPVMGLAMWLWTFVDVKVIDGAVNGLAWVWGAFGRALRPLQTGRAQSYAFGVFGGLFVLIVIVSYVWKG